MHAKSHYRYPDLVNYIMSSSIEDGKHQTIQAEDRQKINTTDYIFQNKGSKNNSSSFGGLIGRSTGFQGYTGKSKVSGSVYSRKSTGNLNAPAIDTQSHVSGLNAYIGESTKRSNTASRGNRRLATARMEDRKSISKLNSGRFNEQVD
jgi:hypothetical protein